MNTQPNNKKAKPWLIALSGFIGAAGPSICQLIAMIQESQEGPHLSFYVGMLLLGGLGAGVALIARETVPWKAFTQGMATPSLFSSAGTVAVSLALMTGPVNFMSAYADPPVSTEIKSVDSVDVTVTTDDSVRVMSGNRVYHVQQQAVLRVPRNQTMIIENKDRIQTTYNPTDEDSVAIKVRVKESKGTGHFLRGLLPMMNQEKLSPKTLEIEETEK